VSLNIKNPEAHRLAGELARLTGENLTQAVTEALRERLERERRRRNPHALSAELLEIGLRCAAHMPQPAHSSDHADLFYDEQGLPK
jgi:antitoxin VapB